MRLINKRYSDLFDQFVYKGEHTPFTPGTLVICALCFLILIVASFSQVTFVHPWFKYAAGHFSYVLKTVSFNPLIPAMMFVVYILGKGYSYFMFIIYLLVGFFVWPIFALGGGADYIQNYFFGHLVGFLFAILITGNTIRRSQKLLSRLKAAFLGVITIHICGFIYCIILAIFDIIDFSLIFPIIHTITIRNIFYDIVFSLGIMVVAPFIKNILWICMKPKCDNISSRLKSKNARIRNQIIGNDIY